MASASSYQSLASDLLCENTCKAGQADINLLWDVFLHDRRTGETVDVEYDEDLLIQTWRARGPR